MRPVGCEAASVSGSAEAQRSASPMAGSATSRQETVGAMPELSVAVAMPVTSGAMPWRWVTETSAGRTRSGGTVSERSSV